MDGEHLSIHNPDGRSPCRGEAGNEHTSADDEAGANVFLGYIELSTEGTEDKQPGELPEASPDEDSTAAETINEPQAGECADDVDDTKNDLSDVGVFDTDGLEGGGAVVEEVIRTRQSVSNLYFQMNVCIMRNRDLPSELLEHLEKESKGSSVQDFVMRAETLPHGSFPDILLLQDGVCNLLELGVNVCSVVAHLCAGNIT